MSKALVKLAAASQAPRAGSASARRPAPTMLDLQQASTVRPLTCSRPARVGEPNDKYDEADAVADSVVQRCPAVACASCAAHDTEKEDILQRQPISALSIASVQRSPPTVRREGRSRRTESRGNGEKDAS